jgi:MFS family permease
MDETGPSARVLSVGRNFTEVACDGPLMVKGRKPYTQLILQSGPKATSTQEETDMPASLDDWWRPLPRGFSSDALRVLAGRSIRAFADGFVSLLLPVYLLRLGFGAFAIGSIIAGTLVGSALLTLALGMVAHRYSRRRMLRAACLLMAATGAGFALTRSYWPIVIVAFLGTMNPSSGDVSVFLPLEQTVLAETVELRRRTALFARYSLFGTLMGALGTLAAAIPDVLGARFGIGQVPAFRFMFWLYGALGVVALLLYRRLSGAVEAAPAAEVAPRALGESKSIVYRLAALFSLDAFGGGFFVQSLLALWLFQAFHLSLPTASAILFWSSACAALSFLVAVPVAERIGLINTMVFTHLPSNIFLILVPFAPNLPTAIGLLLARNALSQMDVPTRTSYVMAVVTPAERPAAASVTAVPRSLATSISPILAGYLLTLSPFGWPLIIGGTLKAVYDVLLLIKFRGIRAVEERPAR